MLIFSALPTDTTASAAQYDLLIKNGRIIDGSGQPGYTADLAVKGDRIVQIGNLKNAKATRVIDAAGLVVAPDSSTCWASRKPTC